jgi:hypothetical protein
MIATIENVNCSQDCSLPYISALLGPEDGQALENSSEIKVWVRHCTKGDLKGWIQI